MSVDRVATAQQTAYFLSQINQAGAALDKTNQQIASGKVSNTYAGFGDQAQFLTATISAKALNDSYSTATTLATTQADIQDTQLTSLSALATQLKTAVSTAVANNDPSTLMSQVQNIFDQATGILNSKDANGDYIYSGGKTGTPPVTVSSLAALVALPAVSGAFANGDNKKSVQVAAGQTVTFGVTASDVATGLMQSLKDIATFDAGGSGNFSGSVNLSQAQNTFLTGEIAPIGTVAGNLNTVTAQNGFAYNQLKNATTQQTDLSTLYSGFISNMQDTNMAQAATQLSLNQTALQAALQVTSSLNHLSLLNFLPVGG
ncbi:MAG TPA: flagellin [Rhizomicrobium sp.]|jgi:flagellar hook-associated protein 3 FlgL|nr:flagellin [Rhizomicrobium sp.]